MSGWWWRRVVVVAAGGVVVATGEGALRRQGLERGGDVEAGDHGCGALSQVVVGEKEGETTCREVSTRWPACLSVRGCGVSRQGIVSAGGYLVLVWMRAVDTLMAMLVVVVVSEGEKDKKKNGNEPTTRDVHKGGGH
ncbi:hypothetical protein EDB84DRAFT_1435793 [Lactarius hengduanensis]|nr:hypothetical protein EDB84DRAFT_1435793 [Lactarius hengduanensis]